MGSNMHLSALSMLQKMYIIIIAVWRITSAHIHSGIKEPKWKKLSDRFLRNVERDILNLILGMGLNFMSYL